MKAALVQNSSRPRTWCGMRGRRKHRNYRTPAPQCQSQACWLNSHHEILNVMTWAVLQSYPLSDGGAVESVVD